MNPERSQRRRLSRQSGVFFAIIAIVLFAVSAYALAILASTIQQSNAATGTGQDEAKIYYGMVGDPNVPGTFGYVGDVGDYPSSLADLLTNPGATGWNGPYVTDARLVNGLVIDSYNSPLEYFKSLVAGTSDQVTVISRGPDHSSTDSANNSNNPNVAANFGGTPLPTSAGYSAAPNNTDNVAFPNFFNNIDATLRNNAGTLAYNITNYDTNGAQAVVPGCSMYTINVTSVSRGANDTIALQYQPGLTDQFIQGAYDVVITSQQSNAPVWAERVAINPGKTVTQNILAPPIDNSAASTTYTVTVYNGTGMKLDLRSYTSGGSSNGSVNNASNKTFMSLNPCQTMYLTNGATVWDSFELGTANRTRFVNTLGTCSLTVTNTGAHSNQLQVLFQDDASDDSLLGTVALRQSQTFTLPQNNLPSGSPVSVTVLIKDEPGTTTLQTISYTTTCPANVSL